jgi:hypothetical protein
VSEINISFEIHGQTYLLIQFTCGHSRLTRSKFDKTEINNPGMWHTAMCDECKKPTPIVKLSLPK